MASESEMPSLRPKWLTILLAIVYGLLIALVAANMWPLLLLKLGTPFASVAEILFLAAYVWWASGGGGPQGWKAARADAFRSTSLTSRQWAWGLLAAVFFAITVHSSIVLLF